MSSRVVYLIPSQLNESGFDSIPSYILPTVKECDVLFAENIRTARRYLKKLSKDIVIDDFDWFDMADSKAIDVFRNKIKESKVIGIISEAGCPGIADPGQHLIAIAHEENAEVKPLVGPNSIILALMASGMNGQQFRFVGYLPIKQPDRNRAIRELEDDASKNDCTQIFIETPYRNNQLIRDLLAVCHPTTKICIAADLTGETQFIKTRTVAGWKREKTDIHKRPAIFLLYAS